MIVAMPRHRGVQANSQIAGWQHTAAAIATLVMLIALASFPRPAAAQNDVARSIIEKALVEYRTALESKDRAQRLERFRRSAAMFAAALDPHLSADPSVVKPIHNADLYVNWGNAALGAEQLGEAILAYRRALLLDPDHSRARQNLTHARSLLPDWVPRPEESTLWATFFAWALRLSPAQWQMAAGWVFLIASLMLAAAIRWQFRGLRNLAILVFALWVAVLVPVVFFGRSERFKSAVIVGPEVVARSADSAYAPPRFAQPLPSGVEVKIIERRPEWLRVRLSDGREAWVPATAIQLVDLPEPAASDWQAIQNPESLNRGPRP